MGATGGWYRVGRRAGPWCWSRPARGGVPGARALRDRRRRVAGRRRRLPGRGIRDVRLADLTDVRSVAGDAPWNSVLLLGGNLGLAGDWEPTRALLAALSEVISPGGVLIGDSVDPSSDDPDDLAYEDRNVAQGLHRGHVRLRLRYEHLVTPWWDLLNLPPAEIEPLVDGTGWMLEDRFGDDEGYASCFATGDGPGGTGWGYAAGGRTSVMIEDLMRTRSAAEYADFVLPLIGPNDRVADVGCGPGSTSIGLAEVAGQVTGVDVDDDGWDEARTYAADHGIANVEFLEGSIYELPFPDSSIDVCTMHSMLETVDDPPAGLAEVRRVVKPGGVVAASSIEYGGLDAAWPRRASAAALLRAAAGDLGGARGRVAPTWPGPPRAAHAAGFTDVEASIRAFSYGTEERVRRFGLLHAADCRDEWYVDGLTAAASPIRTRSTRSSRRGSGGPRHPMRSPPSRGAARSRAGPDLRLEVQAPVVAARGAAATRREVDLAEQREAERAADPVRRRVLDPRVGVHEPVHPLRSRELDQLGGRRARDAPALEARKHGPAGLPDLLALPGDLPVADPSGCLVLRLHDDPVLPGVGRS